MDIRQYTESPNDDTNRPAIGSSDLSLLELVFEPPLITRNCHSLPEFLIADKSGYPGPVVGEFESEYDEQRTNKILVELLGSANGDKQAIGKRFCSLLERPQQNVIGAALSVLCEDYPIEDLKKLLGAVEKLYHRENIKVLYVLNEMFSKESANSASGKAVKTLISMLAEGGAPATVAEKWLGKLTDPRDATANRCILERI